MLFVHVIQLGSSRVCDCAYTLLSLQSRQQRVKTKSISHHSRRGSLLLLVVLLGVTKVSEELRINLRVRLHTHAHSLHAASALAKRLLDSVLVVLDTLVTSSMMLLLHHSTIRSAPPTRLTR